MERMPRLLELVSQQIEPKNVEETFLFFYNLECAFCIIIKTEIVKKRRRQNFVHRMVL